MGKVEELVGNFRDEMLKFPQQVLDELKETGPWTLTVRREGKSTACEITTKTGRGDKITGIKAMAAGLSLIAQTAQKKVNTDFHEIFAPAIVELSVLAKALEALKADMSKEGAADESNEATSTGS